ncbi:uncharacterized protein LOC124366893 [Homalodisca vitripennis]|uniref:uncharacterized protein LOC124366893 n=1 Tax=Homalodisca vitripennis TaxID=197043 RepID=UPI001EEAA7A5|nr:uncharacterized protein LOC124366893 [Homalodisca vitripennis]
MGDFNCSLLGPDNYDKTNLANLFRSCNLTILLLNTTHHTATADTLLDVMAVADPDRVVHHGQYPAPGLSRHDLIFCVYRLSIPKACPKFVSFRNYKYIDSDALLNNAWALPWNEVILAPTVDLMVNKFSSFVSSLCDQHAPLVTRRVTRRPAPWITDVIRNLQAQRDSAFRKAKRTKSPAD